MRFNVNSDVLSKNIQGLAKMVNGKASLAILDHFLFEVDGDKLYVTASDSENMMKTTMDIDTISMPEEETDKRFCIHNTVICDFLKNIAQQPLLFDVDMENNKVTISYMNGQVNFPCNAGKEFPKTNIIGDESKNVTLPSGLILDDINRTSPFIGQETFRPIMNAICFNFKNDALDVVSSNGSVLVIISHDNISCDDECTLLLPPKPVALLKYFLCKEEREVSIRYTDNAAVFSCDNWELTCRLIEGRYPNYNCVIPSSDNVQVLVDRKELQNSIRRMLPMGNPTAKVVKIEVNPTTLNMSSEDIDFNKSAKEDIPCETAGNEIRIGVNGETLNCILTHIASDIVRLKMTEPSRAILVVPDEDRENETFLGLLMPCLLN